MRVLFDNGVPRPVATALLAHAVEEARARGWDSRYIELDIPILRR